MKYLLLPLSSSGLSASFTSPQVTRTPLLKGNHVLDLPHISVVWRIFHAGLSSYTARLDEVRGILEA